MTRQDYEIIARAMRHVFMNYEHRDSTSAGMFNAMVDALGAELKKDNSRFDIVRFKAAINGGN